MFNILNGLRGDLCANALTDKLLQPYITAQLLFVAIFRGYKNHKI